MRNTKLYYILQSVIVAISAATFFNFTYPYILASTFEKIAPPVKPPVVAYKLPDIPETMPVPSEKIPDVAEKPLGTSKPRYSAVAPRTNINRESSRSGAKPDIKVGSSIPLSPSSTENIDVRQNINVSPGSGPVTINKQLVPTPISSPVVSEGITMEKAERFFKFSSSVVGTIFPLIGFSMTVALWINQRKQKKLESV
jgi:hypothetical protein